MRVLVLGGDGYLGWPTAMQLSALGHDVAVVDNYLRRDLMRNEDVEPLYPILNLDERIKVWRDFSGKEIEHYIGNLAEWDFVAHVFQEAKPEVVIHYAEQPSAPYSMLRRQAASLTLNNNITVTANIIFAVREYCPDVHIIKLGTMGEYGTPNIDIEEGWIDIKHNGRTGRFLYPRQAGSLYHTTNIMDTELLWYYVRIWGLRVTDLMQGPVYGIETEESSIDERLKTFFNYDEIFGTIINRFITQAVVGHPLSIYGKGGQTRGYLNIKDTLQCVFKAEQKPAHKGELRIFNQIMETFSVIELAEKTVQIGNSLGYQVKIKHLKNPRKEAEKHYYNPTYQGLIEIGVEPHYLTEEVMKEIFRSVAHHKDSIRKDIIFQGIKW